MTQGETCYHLHVLSGPGKRNVVCGMQAKLCAKHGIAHIVNNAYGVQCAQLCKLLTAACRRGRVDAYVQSTDKNFMVCMRSFKPPLSTSNTLL